MIKIDKAKLDYLNSIEAIAILSKDMFIPNNRMIYYLCCTVFSKYSFVAIKDDFPVGFLFTVCEPNLQFIWLYQLSVAPVVRKHGIGKLLLSKLAEEVIEENRIKIARWAVRRDNIASISLAQKFQCKSLGFDENIRMEILEKEIDFDFIKFQSILNASSIT